MFSRVFALKCSLVSNKFIVRHLVVNAKVPYARFHLSPSRKLINPLLWKILQPISRVGAAVFGRWFRKWWRNLPHERQRQLYDKFMRNRHRLILVGVGFFGCSSVYYWYHVQKAPITNRRRFISLTQAQFEQLIEFVFTLLMKFFESSMLSDWDSRVRRVRRVAKKLLEANSDLEEFKKYKWAVHVIDSPVENCFILPNGHIFMFTGILDNILTNDDYLAIVLGHEMAHAVLGHSLEQFSRGKIIDLIKIAVTGIIWAVIPFDVTAEFTDILSDSIMDITLDLPYSRKLEMEADDVGLVFASKALKVRANCKCPPLKRYDPRILADYKKQMIEQELAALNKRV